MTKYKELEDMIEVMNLAIVRQETEEQFFYRSAKGSTSEIAKQLFSEIAADLSKYRESLEVRREKLLHALNDLKAAEREAKTMEKNMGSAENRDPVCSMKIDRDKCNFVSTYQGKEYRFCSEDCKKAFEANPEKYTRNNLPFKGE